MKRSALISSVAAFIVATLAVIGVCGGGPVPQAAPQVPAVTSEVLVDVVVTDKKNRLVTNLKAEDFVIYEDGAPQQIVSFRLNSAEHGASSSSKAEPAEPAGAPAAQGDVAGQERPLVAMVVLDYSTTDFQNEKQIREGAAKYINEKLRSGDRMAVFALTTSLHPLTPFTSDKQLLVQAFNWRQQVEAAKAGAGTENQLSSSVNVGSGTAPAQTPGGAAPTPSGTGDLGAGNRMSSLFAAMQSGIEQRTSRGVLTAIKALAEGSAQMQGRKALILFSQGFVVDPVVEEEMKSVVESAQRANVAVFCIDPTGLVSQNTASNDPQRDDLNTAAKIGAPQRDRIQAAGGIGIFDRAAISGHDMGEGALRYIANETGGTLTRNTNSFAPALAGIDREMREYYVLTYKPANPVPDGNFHAIRVEVKQPNLTVRARSGYYAVPPGLEALRPNEAQLVLAARAASGSSNSTLFIKAAGFREADGQYRVPVILETPAKNIQFKRNGPNYVASLEFVGLARDVSRPADPPVRFLRAAQIQLNEAEYKVLLPGSVSVMDTLHLPPGAYSFEIVAKDNASGRLLRGEQGLYLREPEDQFALSAIVLSNQFSKATPQDRNSAGAIVTQGVRLSPCAECRFSNGDNVVFYFDVYNARVDAQKKADLLVDVTLQTNDKRVPVVVPRYRINGVADAQSRAVEVARYLQLSKLQPGDYSLIVHVTDALSSRTTSARATFRIAN